MTTSLNETLALKVQRFRRDQGISQEKLAELSGLHRTYIGQVERGEANVTLDAVEALALALELTPLCLLQEEGTND